MKDLQQEKRYLETAETDMIGDKSVKEREDREKRGEERKLRETEKREKRHRDGDKTADDKPCR
jgi:hypothetical protein